MVLPLFFGMDNQITNIAFVMCIAGVFFTLTDYLMDVGVMEK